MEIYATDEGRLCRVRMAELLWGKLDLDGLIRGIAEFVEDRSDLVHDRGDGSPLGAVDEVKWSGNKFHGGSPFGKFGVFSWTI